MAMPENKLMRGGRRREKKREERVHDVRGGVSGSPSAILTRAGDDVDEDEDDVDAIDARPSTPRRCREPERFLNNCDTLTSSMLLEVTTVITEESV